MTSIFITDYQDKGGSPKGFGYRVEIGVGEEQRICIGEARARVDAGRYVLESTKDTLLEEDDRRFKHIGFYCLDEKRHRLNERLVAEIKPIAVFVSARSGLKIESSLFS